MKRWERAVFHVAMMGGSAWVLFSASALFPQCSVRTVMIGLMALSVLAHMAGVWVALTGEPS